MQNSKPTVLITGAAGYIGSHAVKKFLENNHKVITLDNYHTGFKGAIEALKQYGDFNHYEADIKNKADLSKVFEENPDIEAIIHFAALLSVNESMERPIGYFQNNVGGTLNVIDKAIKHNITKFIFSSTCAVYGESQYLPVDEKHPTNPTNPYGESKRLVEKMLKWGTTQHQFNYVSLRYFNICGASEDGNIGDAKKPSVHLMQNAVKGALGLMKFELTYPTVDTPDCSPIRDYIDVNDLIDAHYQAYEYLENGGESDIFNLGTGKGNSVEEIVSKVEEVTQIELPREKGETRKGEYAAVYANNDKAKEILGWVPKRSLEDSVKSLKKWYEMNPNGFN